MLESPSNPLKTHIVAQNPQKLWTTKSDGLFHSQDMPSSSKCKQICIKILALCKHQQKIRDLNLKFFCSLSYKSSRVFRGLEQLSSLFWRRVIVISKLGVIQPRFSFVGVEILTTFWFLWHRIGSRYARKPIEGSKDSDDSQVSQKNWAKKLAHWIGVQGRVKGQKNRNYKNRTA